MAFEISGLASFVSKIENNSLPFFPLVTKACQAILTVRKSKDSRQQAIDQINERARSTDRHVKQLLIFPEATTANNRVRLWKINL
jgi:1-acyl-sn-glycerol-3-phosphate acyltransferase